MRDLHLRVVSIATHLEDSPVGETQALTELLFFPEISTFTNRVRSAHRRQRDLASTMLLDMEPEELARRQLPKDGLRLYAVDIEIEPADTRGIAWREPVQLRIEGLHWEQPDAATVYIPMLRIEIVASDLADLERMVQDHVRFALTRAGALTSLYRLSLLDRAKRLETTELVWNAYPRSPAERYIESLGEEKKREVLKEVGTRMFPARMRQAFERECEVEVLAQWLLGRRPVSVLVVGDSGVGKTAVIEELVRTNEAFKINRRPVWRTGGARIVAGMSGFGDWQDRCLKIIAEAKDTNALLYFGNLFELLEVGQSSCSSENIASFVRPWIGRGEIQVIFECTPQQLSAIERGDPRILDVLRQLKLEEPEPAAVESILEKSANHLSHNYRTGRDFSEACIARIMALHRRFASYSAFPGRALGFIEKLRELHQPSGDKTVTAADADRAFAAETGMPAFLIDEQHILDLTRAQAWFRERVIGQDGAVDTVIDAVAAIKARMSRPGKPLASFLFIGPTGVGKTELARTLATFFYGDRERMIRLDMSEFSTPGSAGRLASGSMGDAEGILTSQIRDQPFSVLLLDEFEKASPEVYDLFLQVLGEARLTDGAGRVADFSNSIIVLTSNLGAQTFTGSRFGFHAGDGRAEAAVEHFTEVVKRELRPEFFNRIDRIVSFLPLERRIVREVVKRELSLVDHRDGLRNRNLALCAEDAVIDFLVEAGYDPRYGARPVKRAIEQHVLQPLAVELNETGRRNGILEVTLAGGGRSVVFKFVSGEEQTRKGVIERRKDLEEIPARRRSYQNLFQSSMASQLFSERSQLQRKTRAKKGGRKSGAAPPGLEEDLKRLAELEELLNRLQLERTAVLDAEQALLLSEYGESDTSAHAPPAAQDYRSTLIDVYSSSERASDQITLVIQADSLRNLRSMLELYLGVGAEFGCDRTLGVYRRPPEPLPDGYAFYDPKWDTVRPEVIDLEKLAEVLEGAGTLAAAIQFTRQHAYLRFRWEGGAHLQIDEEGKNTLRAQVLVFDSLLEKTWCELGKLVRPDLKALPVRRQFDLSKGTYKDAKLERKARGVRNVSTVRELIEEVLQLEAEAEL